jgi:hypothetical protein
VNRALVDTGSGFKLTGHTEKYYTEGGATKTSGDNAYARKDAPAPALADQQTVREIERLFGRVFRARERSSPTKRPRPRCCRSSRARM